MALTARRRLVLSGLLAILGLTGWFRTRQKSPTGLSVMGVLAPLALLALFFALSWLALGTADRRAWRFALPLGFAAGLSTACGVELFRYDLLDFSLGGIAGKLLSALCLTGAAAAAAAVVIVFLPRVTAKKHLTRLSPRAVFFLSWAVILLCWLPCFIAFYPGIFAYDIPTQIMDFNEGVLTADHPLLHTLIAWGCLQWGAALGSYRFGAAMYTALQTLALSAAFAAVLGYLRRLEVWDGWLAMVLGWFALLPVHPLFAVNATKDVLFAACVIFYLLLVAELVRRTEACLGSVPFLAGYLAAVLVMSLMRNTGIYVCLLFIPVLLALLPRRRLGTLALCLASVVLFFAVQAALRSALGVLPGRVTEPLSVPLQQMARCANDGALDQEELAALERFIPNGVVWSYSSRLADPVKNQADRDAIAADPMGFWGLWVRLGLRHPGCYLKAFLGLNIGYWYPEMVYPDSRTYHAYIECENKVLKGVSILYPDLWPAARNFYRGVGLQASFRSLPGLSLLFTPGVYFWATLCVLAAACYHRRRAAGVIAAFLTVSWLFQFFSPIALLRYVYPFMTALPLAAGLLRKPPEDPAQPKAAVSAP